jgi:hypothetical protein
VRAERRTSRISGCEPLEKPASWRVAGQSASGLDPWPAGL